MNAAKTEKAFVTYFIRKERIERSLWLLNHQKKRSEFIDRFNHNWEDMIAEKNIVPLDVETSEKVKSIFHLKDADPCYVISHDDYDGQYIPFKTAFEAIQNSGFAGLIISPCGKKYYLKTEQVVGASRHFIGIK